METLSTGVCTYLVYVQSSMNLWGFEVFSMRTLKHDIVSFQSLYDGHKFSTINKIILFNLVVNITLTYCINVNPWAMYVQD